MGPGSTSGGLNYDKLKEFVGILLEALNLQTFGEKIFNDLKSSWWIILLAVFLGSFISFMWIILMRFIASVMVWTSILLSIGLLGMYNSLMTVSEFLSVLVEFRFLYSQYSIGYNNSGIQLKNYRQKRILIHL